MKRRVTALLCALVMLWLLVPAGAEPQVYVISINDTVSEIRPGAMPFWSGGYLYVPCDAFEELDIYYSHSSARKSLMLYRSRGGGDVLFFDLKKNTLVDNQGRSYPERAVTRNGTVFVPAARVADYFGITYTYHKIEYGYLVRLCNDEVVLSDRVFLDAATERIAYRYNEYLEAAAAYREQQEAQLGLGDGCNVYLSALVEDTVLAQELLEGLGNSSYMTFYLRPALLGSAGDLTRRMMVTGQGIGLAVDASGGTEAVLEELRLANEQLRRATGGKTRLVWLENASEETVTAVTAAGYCPAGIRVDAAERGLNSYNDARWLLDRIGDLQQLNVPVWLGSNASQNGVRALLSIIGADGDQLLPMTEAIL